MILREYINDIARLNNKRINFLNLTDVYDNSMEFFTSKNIVTVYFMEEEYMPKEILVDGEMKPRLDLNSSVLLATEKELDNEEFFVNYCKENNIDASKLREELTKRAIEAFSERYIGNRKDRLEDEIESKSVTIMNLKRELKIRHDELISKKCELAGLDVRNDIIDRVKNELSLIANHKKVSELIVDSDGDFIIEVNVHDIICREPEEERFFKMPDTRIIINVDNADIRFLPVNKEDKNRRHGLWGAGQVHPHVDRHGYPCAGNAAQQFSVYASEMEIYAVFITALGFLQACNIDDSAGRYVYRWDEVDKDGNIIREADGEYVRPPHYCDVCGEPIDEDDVYTCRDCDAVICANCATRTYEDDYICERCYDENYIVCAYCDEVYHYTEASEDLDGNWYCDACRQSGAGYYRNDDDDRVEIAF